MYVCQVPVARKQLGTATSQDKYYGPAFNETLASFGLSQPQVEPPVALSLHCSRTILNTHS